ncbi:MAG: YeeE/YedE family protein [Treponema socranskii subsp. buccale]
MNKIENSIGFIALILSLVLGSVFLSGMFFFRWVIGIGIGYVLTRAFFGFAGSVNRAFRTGSTKLMRTLMLMFTISAILTASFLIFTDASAYKLSIHPINAGLLIGGLLFGFGMSLSSCCASGSLTDIVTGLPRGGITLLFLCLGVFVGFPFQAKASWVKDSWFVSGSGRKGVFFPDWFAKDGKGGYLGAILVTVLLASIVTVLSYLYERKRKNANTFSGVASEKNQDVVRELDTKHYKFFSAENYENIFAKPWTLTTGAFAFSILFTLLMGVTKAGWGVSTPFGFWFGKFLGLFGVSAESLASFSGKSPDFYKASLFSGTSIQDLGIIMGTIICLLLAGSFTKTCKSELKFTVTDALVYALGGFTMGIGTRFANGCNAGALYTPIANFSLSGWIYLVVIVLGGIAGNRLLKSMKRI